MRGVRMFVMTLALAGVVTPALAASVPQASRGSAAIGMIQYGSIEGRVTAVDLKTKSMQVAAMEGSAAGPQRLMFTDKTVIHQGVLPRRATDIRVGEHVDVLYAGSGTWVADNIDILEPSVAEAHYLGNGAR